MVITKTKLKAHVSVGLQVHELIRDLVLETKLSMKENLA